MNKPKVLHLVIDLSGFGGAEMTLLRYLGSTSNAAGHHSVLTLKAIKPGPSVGAELHSIGIPVRSLGIRGIKSMVLAVPNLIREVRAARPDILSAWLYYPSLIATLLKPFLPGKPNLIWHIRSLPFVRLQDRPARWLTQRVLALLSYLVSVRIVSNSDASRRAHAAIGFRATPDTWQVIPNAVDAARYAPNAETRRHIRQDLRLPEKTIVLGAVGRDVPEKGYPDLFQAFEKLQSLVPNDIAARLQLLIAGREVQADNPTFAALIAASGLPPDRFHLLGARGDIPELLTAMDLFIMPSRSESFPNALAEAMAAGLPAIATDVGDCRLVLDDDRFIATAETLANAMATLLTLSQEEQQAIGARNRDRVKERYTIEKMTRAFDEVFERQS